MRTPGEFGHASLVEPDSPEDDALVGATTDHLHLGLRGKEANGRDAGRVVVQGLEERVVAGGVEHVDQTIAGSRSKETENISKWHFSILHRYFQPLLTSF